MHTIELQHEISYEQFETVRKLLKAIDIKVKKPKDTKMSEEEFYAKIDRARNQKPIKMSFNELKALHEV